MWAIDVRRAVQRGRKATASYEVARLPEQSRTGYLAPNHAALSGRSCMSRGQAEQPIGRGLNLLLGHPVA